MREPRIKVETLCRGELITASFEDSVAKAAKRMRLHEVSALPIVQHDRVLGIVTERDITRAVAEGMDPKTATVADVMTQHPLIAGPDEDAVTVAIRMLEHGIRHLPVVADQRLLGVISARDLLSLEVLGAPH
jgi:CBS domain-containing protein